MLFSEFVEQYRSGVLDNALGMELQKVVNAVQNHQRAGVLKLTIAIKPKVGGELDIAVKHEKKMPYRDTMSSIMFATPEGNLMSNDPSQPKLFDKVETLVDSETGEVLTPTRKIIED